MKKQSLLLFTLLFISLSATAQSVSLATSSANPSKGTVYYNNTTNQLEYWNGTAWIAITNAASGTGWALNGTAIYNNNAGNVGIGTATPMSKLEINSNMANSSGINLRRMIASTSNSFFAQSISVIGLVYIDDSHFFSTDFTGNKIRIYNSFIKYFDPFVSSGLDGPHDIVYGPDGFLYVSNFHSGKVVKISLAGTMNTFATGFFQPTGLTFDTNGNLFVVNNGNGTVSKVTPAGGITHNFITGLTSPYGCVFDPLTHRIFIANYGANEVAEANAINGGAKTTFKSGVDFCTGITRTGSGDLFVAQATPNKIVRITPDGELMDYATTDYPLGITFDANDNLYAANQKINRVTIIAPLHNNSLLGINSSGDVVKTGLAQNGYKLYIDNSVNPDWSGVKFSSDYGKGVESYSKNNIGIIGESESATGIVGASISKTGVYGESNSGEGIYGVSNSGYAGLFEGNVKVTGTLCAANVSCPSDFRLKRDIIPLSASLKKLGGLTGYHYYWKDSTQNRNLQTGVIAQDLQKIFPELVNEGKDGYLSVNYTGLIPHLIEAVKELKSQNEESQTQNETLKTENEAMKKQMSRYDSRLESLEASLKATIKQE